MNYNIRYVFIKKQILNLLKLLPPEILSFPLNPKEIIKYIEDCNISSYSSFAKHYHVTIDDVILMCRSKSGCTHFNNCKYLIMYNDTTENNNVLGRQHWTIAHELGHIRLNHITQLTEKQLDKNLLNLFEKEADFFAAALLSPLPLFRYLNIESSSDVKSMFGLSMQASVNRFDQYLKWNKSHAKTSFDNDIVKVFKHLIE